MKIKTVEECDDCEKDLTGKTTYYDKSDKKTRCEKCNLKC